MIPGVFGDPPRNSLGKKITQPIQKEWRSLEGIWDSERLASKTAIAPVSTAPASVWLCCPEAFQGAQQGSSACSGWKSILFKKQGHPIFQETKSFQQHRQSEWLTVQCSEPTGSGDEAAGQAAASYCCSDTPLWLLRGHRVHIALQGGGLPVVWQQRAGNCCMQRENPACHKTQPTLLAVRDTQVLHFTWSVSRELHRREKISPLAITKVWTHSWKPELKASPACLCSTSWHRHYRDWITKGEEVLQSWQVHQLIQSPGCKNTGINQERRSDKLST